jgi:hypothetical protein
MMSENRGKVLRMTFDTWVEAVIEELRSDVTAVFGHNAKTNDALYDLQCALREDISGYYSDPDDAKEELAKRASRVRDSTALLGVIGDLQR